MWPDENGEFLKPVEGWVDPTGTTPQNGPQVQANDVFTQSTVSEGPDRWGGFWGVLADGARQGIAYALAKDAKASGLVQSTSPNGQPVYRTAGAPAAQGTIGGNGLLIIGIAVVLAVALAGGKG